MRHELLALGEEAALVEDARSDASLDALHEGNVLAPDLAVEGDQLVDPALLDAGCEEVIEVARRPLRTDRNHRPAGEVRPAGEDVDAEVRPEEMELAAWDVAVRQERVAVPAQRAKLAGDEAARLEPVGVRRDVNRCAEAGVRDRAVVALEEVLAGD